MVHVMHTRTCLYVVGGTKKNVVLLLAAARTQWVLLRILDSVTVGSESTIKHIHLFTTHTASGVVSIPLLVLLKSLKRSGSMARLWCACCLLWVAVVNANTSSRLFTLLHFVLWKGCCCPAAEQPAGLASGLVEGTCDVHISACSSLVCVPEGVSC